MRAHDMKRNNKQMILQTVPMYLLNSCLWKIFLFSFHRFTEKGEFQFSEGTLELIRIGNRS